MRGIGSGGLCLGAQEFAEKLLKLAPPNLTSWKARPDRSTLVLKAHHEMQAEQWLQEGREGLEWGMKEFQTLQSIDAWEAALAQVLWRKTTVSQTWLGERLGMSSAANVRQVLKRPATMKPPSRGSANWLETSVAGLKSVKI